MERVNIYRNLTLLRLAELIAGNSDRKALQELHDHRRVFYYHSNQSLRLAEFADKLRHSKPAWRWCKGDMEVLEKAYDLTISKFSNLPNLKKNAPKVKLQGPNCRYYYEAFIKHVAKKINAEFDTREDNREKQMTELLQNLVIRHFRLSCHECSRRGSELTTRYLWQVNGHTMEILLPVDIEGRQRGKWLTDNIPDVDPMRPGERERVQAIVDRVLTKRKIISLENMANDKIATGSSWLRPEIGRKITVSGLADAVANEKAENIKFQRAVIQQLGKDKLRRLIHQIFNGLAYGKYEARKIAEGFGINPTTFSRFAGSRWSSETGKDGQDSRIPDLWFNTAETIAGNPVFVIAAEAAGVFKRVEEILESDNA